MVDEPKQKANMISEEEHKKRLTQELERLRTASLSYTITHGFRNLPGDGANIPQVTVSLSGGNAKAVHEVALAIERLILSFSEANPPE